MARKNETSEMARYIMLLMQGKNPLFEDGKRRALLSIKEGATGPDEWVITHPIEPSYIAGYISVFKSIGMLGTNAEN